MFTDSDNGNYHLKSEFGRWQPFKEAYDYLDPNDTPMDPNDYYWDTVPATPPHWVYDDVTSPCIDAGAFFYGTTGDPNDWREELWPHGKRINMGAYGGTPQASMSPTPVGNIADLDHDDVVDVNDLALLSEDWLSAEFLLDSDLNRDGRVDLTDYAEFTREWERAFLSVSETLLSPMVHEGDSEPVPEIITISNIGGGTLNWIITDVNEITFSPPNWLTITHIRGSLEHNQSQMVTLLMNATSLSAGSYEYTFEISDPRAQSSPKLVTVDLTVIGPALVVSSNTFSFSANEGGTSPASVTMTVSNSGGGVLDWSIDDTGKPDWVTISPTNGSLGQDSGETITLSLSTIGLPFGSYSYTFEVSDPAADNSPQAVTLQLYIRTDHLLVPDDFYSIQTAIDCIATNGTIVVSPGRYYENLRYPGRDFTLRSTNPEDPNIVAVTIIDGNQNGSVVILSGNESAACQLRGLTITRGRSRNGGGIRGNGSLATIGNCIITDNHVAGGYATGGGLYTCDGHIENCIVRDNTATYFGAGFSLCDGLITNCTVLGNTAEYHGGGFDRCDGTIENCRVINNTANDYGGGLSHCYGAIVNCIISGNSADGGGGLSQCRGTIKNCTIIGNSAYNHGEPYWYTFNGGGLAGCDGTITNCIIWGNTAEDEGDQLYACITPTYTCVQGWTGGGTGNIAGNPLFVDTSSGNPADWDLHLLIGSPCIDAGTNTPPGGLPATDIEANPRIIDGDTNGSEIVDMGAYEFSMLSDGPYLYLNQGSLSFSAPASGANPDNQAVIIQNLGNSTLNWSVDLTGKPDWLTVTPTSGSLTQSASESITLSVDITGMSAGQYSYNFDVADSAAQNSPQTVSVDLEIFDLTEGLITHWKFDGDATDDSGNGYHGTIHGTPDWIAEGKVDGAVQIDPNDHFEIDTYYGLAGSANRTCCAWINTEYSDDRQMIMSWGRPEAGKSWSLYLGLDGEPRVSVFDGNFTVNSTVNDGQWHHIAAVLDDEDGVLQTSDIRIYVDGVNKTVTRVTGTDPGPDLDTSGDMPVTIGVRNYNGLQVGEDTWYYKFYFDGSLDDARIYDRVLTESEVAALAGAD